MYCGLVGSEGGGGGDEEKKRRIYSGAKYSIVKHWFSVMRILLLNVFACKESSIREYCVLIRELGYANPRLYSPS
jgi:hypothetical protein